VVLAKLHRRIAISYYRPDMTTRARVGGSLNRVQASIVHPGSPGLLADGENLEIDPPRRLVQSFHALWGEDVEREGTSRVTWEIEPVGDACRLTITHDQLREGADQHLYGGWPMILSGLKTWLETGHELTTPGSLMYGGPR